MRGALRAGRRSRSTTTTSLAARRIMRSMAMMPVAASALLTCGGPSTRRKRPVAVPPAGMVMAALAVPRPLPTAQPLELPVAVPTAASLALRSDGVQSWLAAETLSWRQRRRRSVSECRHPRCTCLLAARAKPHVIAARATGEPSHTCRRTLGPLSVPWRRRMRSSSSRSRSCHRYHSCSRDRGHGSSRSSRSYRGHHSSSCCSRRSNYSRGHHRSCGHRSSRG